MTRTAAAWLSLALLLAACVAACGETRSIPDFHGVRLGMTPREVRDRFDLPGKFEVATDSATDDITMHFVPSAAESVASAQFEFHMGALVAVRADVTKADPSTSNDDIIATRAEVFHRDHAAAATATAHIDLLSRDCPTHTVEANRLAAGK